MKQVLIVAAVLASATPAHSQDWTGWYGGVFAGFSQIHGANDRWPSLPIAGRIDGSLLISSPSGLHPSTSWETFAVTSPYYAELGGTIGYSNQIDRLIFGAELSASISTPASDNWGVGYSLTWDGSGYSFGTSEAWINSGLSAELIGRIGVQVHDKVALFASAGVAIDNRGIVGALDRVGPGDSVFNWTTPWSPPTYTPDPGPQAELHVLAKSGLHVSPLAGASAEFSLGDGWRLRTEYQAKFTAAETVTVDVVRTTSDPSALPVTSDTVPMHINAYATHTTRLGFIKAF